MRLRTVIFLLIAGLATAIQVTAHSSTIVPSPIFGIVEAYYRPEQAAELGVSWDRIIFAWNYFQPDGPQDFVTDAVPQDYIETDQKQNRQVVGLIKGTPAWASSSGSVGAVPDNIKLPFDDPRNYFGAFVMRLVRYYSQRGIHHWIILNEPDVRDGEGVVEFQGEVNDYFDVLRVAYLAAKSVDPQAHIQVAGMAWWGDWAAGRTPYLARLLKLISDDPQAADNHWYFDGISLHQYFTTAHIWDVITASRAMLKQYGLTDKEIWLDEFNASPRLDPASTFDAPFRVNLQQQADFIVQASASALAAGANRLAVYRLYDDHFVPGKVEPWGLIRFDDYLRPAYFAYQQVINRFSGAQNVRRLKIPEATVITMSFPDSTLYVMWNDTYKPGQFLIHAGDLEGDITVFDAEGEATVEPLIKQVGVSLAAVDAPAAQKIDMPWLVVSGAVRMVQLPGRPRTIWFKTGDGLVGQFN